MHIPDVMWILKYYSTAQDQKELVDCAHQLFLSDSKYVPKRCSRYAWYGAQVDIPRGKSSEKKYGRF